MCPSTRKTVLTALAISAALMVSACGTKSTDTVDNSEITEMNAMGMMEGTTNDASAMDMATDTNMSMPNAMDNAASEAGNSSDNAAGDNAT